MCVVGINSKRRHVRGTNVAKGGDLVSIRDRVVQIGNGEDMSISLARKREE